jgi:hypothetical protein
VLVLLVVYYFMVTDYLKQRRENKALASRMDEAAQMLAQIPPSPADLEQRLSAAQSDYESTQNSLPDRLNTTRIINAILRLADDVGVKAIPLITQPWTIESVSDHNYSVFRLSVTATGAFTKLVSFINQLESGEPQTLVIESLLVDRVTDTSGEDVTIPVEAKLEIAIYARPPAVDEKEKAE